MHPDRSNLDVDNQISPSVLLQVDDQEGDLPQARATSRRSCRTSQRGNDTTRRPLPRSRTGYLADARSSLPGQRKLDFLFSRIVHQVAVICRFALLGTQKTRGGGSGEDKTPAFRSCFSQLLPSTQPRRRRPKDSSTPGRKASRTQAQWRIREFGSLRVDHFDRGELHFLYA